MATVIQGVDINKCDDEEQLQQILDSIEDFDARKTVRGRLATVKAANRAKRDELRIRTEQEREKTIKQKQEDAIKQKQNMLAMYDKMSKIGAMDIGLYKEGKEGAGKVMNTVRPDLVEEGIQESLKQAEIRKKRQLAAFEHAAQSQDGEDKIVDFKAFQKADVSNFTPGQNRPAVTPTAQVQGGVAKAGAGGGSVKDMLLRWTQAKTKNYPNVNVENFSTSWNDGMAFCALIHAYYPDSFDFAQLDPKNRRYNFDLAFRTAEEKAGVGPLLDTEDMVLMKKPDWKCVFTYIQSLYRELIKLEKK